MSLFKKNVNSVGRPSNETLKKRRNKKIAIVAACLVGVLALGGGTYVLLTGGNLFNLMGNSVTKYDSIYLCPTNTTLQGGYCRGNGQLSKPERLEYSTPKLNEANISEHKKDSEGKIFYNISLPTFIHGTLPSNITVGIEYQIYSNGKWGYSVPNPLSGNKGKTITDAFSIDLNDRKKVRIRGYIVNGSEKKYTGWSNEITITNIKKNTLTLVGNGASVGKTTLTCTTAGTSCKVTLPTITRKGYTVLGFSTNRNASTATYKSGATITINKNMTLYAITNKKVTATLSGNGAILSVNNVSCTMYNQDTNCKIKLPTITRKGYTVLGFSTNRNASTATYKSGAIINIDKNIKLYAITKKPKN